MKTHKKMKINESVVAFAIPSGLALVGIVVNAIIAGYSILEASKIQREG